MADNPVSQSEETRLENLRRAPRCGAKTRRGTPCSSRPCAPKSDANFMVVSRLVRLVVHAMRDGLVRLRHSSLLRSMRWPRPRNETSLATTKIPLGLRRDKD